MTNKTKNYFITFICLYLAVFYTWYMIDHRTVRVKTVAECSGHRLRLDYEHIRDGLIFYGHKELAMIPDGTYQTLPRNEKDVRFTITLSPMIKVKE